YILFSCFSNHQLLVSTFLPSTTLFRSPSVLEDFPVSTTDFILAAHPVIAAHAHGTTMRRPEIDSSISWPAMQRQPPDESEIFPRSEEHTSELQSRENLVCRLLLENKNM